MDGNNISVINKLESSNSLQKLTEFTLGKKSPLKTVTLKTDTRTMIEGFLLEFKKIKSYFELK